MGAESFYVKLFVSDSEETNKSTPHFLSKLADLKINYKSRDTNEFELNNFLIMTLHLNNENIFEISLEGCFSWFNDCVLEIYRVSELIHNQIYHLELINYKGENIPFQNQADFYDAIQEIYVEKYNDFMIRFGINDVKCLPREDFYKYIKKLESRSFIKKLFIK